jgi:hypothetical protein
MKRLAAMQLCPELMSRDVTIFSTASSGSASASITYGSLPPSSRTHFQGREPASRRRHRVPRPDTPSEGDCLDRVVVQKGLHVVDLQEEVLEEALGKSRPEEDLLGGPGTPGNVRSLLEQDAIHRH